jgi:hypothetical protein
MSEDPVFFSNRLHKKKEVEYAPDFYGPLGKGMLVMEELRKSPCLNPLRPDVGERETLENSSGLTPLGLSNNVHKQENDLIKNNLIRIKPQIIAPFTPKFTKGSELNDR